MIARCIALLALLVPIASARAQSSPHESARFEVDPGEVEIGEPIRWTFAIEHDSGTKVRLPDDDPVLDGSWTIVEARRVRREPDVAHADRTITSVTWTVLALEPGERSLPSWVVQCEDDQGKRDVSAAGAKINVRAALAPGEDAPRPMRGPLPAPEGRHAFLGIAPGVWLVGAIALGAIAWIVIRRRRRRAVSVAREPTPLEQLTALRARAASDREAAREIVFAASRLLRKSVDAHRGVSDAAATDADWLRRVESDERLAEGVRKSAARVLGGAESVKYALQVPTPFALEETLKDVEAALGALAESPVPALKEVA